jgi:hypothetical protein
MNEDLKTIQKRTTQYWYSDGLYELAFGTLCLVLALYFLAQELLPKDNLLYPILISSFVIIILGSGFLLARMINIIKTRLTYPRTGYVAYHSKPKRKRWISALLGMCIAFLMSILVVKDLISLSMLPVITGLVFALVMLLLGFRTGLARFPLIGLIALLIGGALSLLGIGDNLGLCVFYGCIGLTFVLSGGCTLRSYLIKTFPPEESSNAGK